MSSITLSIIVPVFNEAASLAKVIEYLMSASYPVKCQWIFIDDCSTDGSREILESLREKYGYTLIKLEKNSGKGFGVARGIKEATGNLIMIQDADFEYVPSDVSGLLEPILARRADVVFGSRFNKNAPQVHRTYHRYINRFLTSLSNLFSGIYLSDMATCYKIFNADIIKNMNLRSHRFGIDIELTAYVAKTRARLFELPIHYYPRTQLQGKKITWKDGVAALFHLINYNFFVSFKKAFNNLPERYRPDTKSIVAYQEQTTQK